MASISTFHCPSLSSPLIIYSHRIPVRVASCFPHPPLVRTPRLRSHGAATSSDPRNHSGLGKIRSVAEETLALEEKNGEEDSASGQPVSVPVSPADKLVMFFQAEGTMNDAAIPTVTQALEATEGVSNLKVQLDEGIASVELTKQTTVQATGVASSLVETIQNSGFKLQTLNLSFEDEDN